MFNTKYTTPRICARCKKTIPANKRCGCTIADSRHAHRNHKGTEIGCVTNCTRCNLSLIYTIAPSKTNPGICKNCALIRSKIPQIFNVPTETAIVPSIPRALLDPFKVECIQHGCHFQYSLNPLGVMHNPSYPEVYRSTTELPHTPNLVEYVTAQAFNPSFINRRFLNDLDEKRGDRFEREEEPTAKIVWFYLFDQAGNLIGYLELSYEYLEEERRMSSQIEMLSVAPTDQGKNLGRLLLTRILYK